MRDSTILLPGEGGGLVSELTVLSTFWAFHISVHILALCENAGVERKPLADSDNFFSNLTFNLTTIKLLDIIC